MADSATTKSNKQIRFGTGGIPLSTAKRDTISGIKRIQELGLQHLELEFVHSVYVAEKDAAAIRQASEAAAVSLTVHGSYYVNLASQEPDKFAASVQRIVAAAERGEQLGAVSVTFHSGFLQKLAVTEVEISVIKGLELIFSQLKQKLPNDFKIIIAPELTGKPNQFGDLSQLIQIVKAFSDSEFAANISFCIDFAHNHARQNGSFATVSEYKSFFEVITQSLGEKYLQNLHMHMSAIEFSPKGERNHLTFLPSFQAYQEAGIDIPELKPYFSELAAKNRLGGGKQDWQGLLKVLREYSVSGYLVCESPLLEADALLLQNYYRAI